MQSFQCGFSLSQLFPPSRDMGRNAGNTSKSRGALTARDRGSQTWLVSWEVSHQLLREKGEP